MPPKTKSLYLIDGHYQMYRSFFAPFRELTSPSGEPTRATFVFCQMLFSLLRDRRPDHLAVVMDVSDETTFRRDLDATYKANRDPTPEALVVQIDRIVSLLESIQVPILRVPGFEADDLMATIAHRQAGESLDVYLVSRDKDLEQLLGAHVMMYDASKSEVVDGKRLQEIKGYTPSQAVEIQTLTGDSTDNIPGVPGIGPKTAVKLIGKYGSAEEVLQHSAELTAKMRERVEGFKEQLPLTRQLVTLRQDAPILFDLDRCAVDRFNLDALRKPFRELNFGRLLEQLDTLTGGPPAQADTEPAKPTTTPVKTRYTLLDTQAALDKFVTRLRKQTVFAFDTETTGLSPVLAELVGMSFSWKAGEACYLPVRGPLGRVLPLEATIDALRPVFEDESVGKVGQNIKYDMLVMRQVGIDVRGVAFDTRLASFLLDPLARSHSIDSLAKRFFDHEMIPISDLIGKGRKQITIDEVDTSAVSDYACEDADFTWRLYEVLADQMAGSPVEKLFRETELPLISVLADMEHCGIALDTKLLQSLGNEMGDAMIELARKIHRAAGHDFNIDSTRQLAAVLFDEQGLSPIRKTKTGRSTDHSTLEALAASTDNEIPGLVLTYRELAKLKSTYIDTLPKMVCRRTGRIHATFDQLGAVTGRLSSRDPNLQNIPIRTETGRRIREAFVAGDDDHLLLAADYSQIELRLLAHFCRDEALVEAFEEGLDIHQAVAAEVNGLEPDQVTPQQRSAAKAVNFGIIYGQGAFGLARGLGISVGEAKAFIDSYFERFPGIRSFIDSCIERARSEGYAETILGRRRPIPELTSRNRQQVSLGERLAVNTVVQGSAADLIKTTMVEIGRMIRLGELEARMLVQVHDELVFEVPRGRLESSSEVIRNSMESALDLSVPIRVDLASGRTWAQSK